jgi:hypothetical protein
MLTARIQASLNLDGLSFASVPLEYDCVPYKSYTIPNVRVTPCIWGYGLFYEGSSALPAGVNVTVYNGVYSQCTPETILRSNSTYIVSLSHYTNDYGATPGYAWYMDAANTKTYSYGVGHYVNSSSPYNWNVNERFPNCWYVEHYKETKECMLPIPGHPVDHRVLIQTICEVQPGEQLLVDYHHMLSAISCSCPVCI